MEGGNVGDEFQTGQDISLHFICQNTEPLPLLQGNLPGFVELSYFNKLVVEYHHSSLSLAIG